MIDIFWKDCLPAWNNLFFLLKERIDARKRERAGTLAPAGTTPGRSAEVIAKKLHVGKGTIKRVIALPTALDVIELFYCYRFLSYLWRKAYLISFSKVYIAYAKMI